MSDTVLLHEANTRWNKQRMVGDAKPFTKRNSKGWLLLNDEQYTERERRSALDRVYKAAQSADAKPADFGYELPPLVRLPYQNCVIDILHMFLRVYDRLFLLTVEDAAFFGPECVEALAGAVRECASLTTFSFYMKADARDTSNSKSGLTLAWKTLDGEHKLQVVDNIDLETIFGRFADQKSRSGRSFKLASRQKLWDKLGLIYRSLREWEQQLLPAQFRYQCESFLKDFLEVDTEVGGVDRLHQDSDVTPYIHALANHVPAFMALYKNLVQFAAFASEKANHDVRSQQNSRRTGRGGGLAKPSGEAQPTGPERHMAQLMCAAQRASINPVTSAPRGHVCQEAGCYSEYSTFNWLVQHYGLVHPETVIGQSWLRSHPTSRRAGFENSVCQLKRCPNERHLYWTCRVCGRTWLRLVLR